jgi:hypothetical protein
MMGGAVRRPPSVSAAVPLALAALAVTGCGATRQRAPDTATAQAPGGTTSVELAGSGVRLHVPRSWARTRGVAPELLGLSSGRATVTLWRYRRTQPLPRSPAALRQATRDLLAATRARDPTFAPSSAGRTRVDGRPAVEVRGTATIAGQQRRVRSVHVYAFGAELVVDAVVEPAQNARVGREVVAPLVRSLRLRDPGPGA